jgi:protein-serine/threonine kinase
MLGAIGEKKSFFHKMFHHEGKEGKEGKHDSKEKLALDIPRPNGFSPSGYSSSRVASPSPYSRDTVSPPMTPGTPPGLSDSDQSRPPSRSASIKQNDGKDPHAQPPTDSRSDKPGLVRRLSQRSASHTSQIEEKKEKKPSATVGGQPVVIGRKEEVVSASGNKFTLKDLIGLGDAPKLQRRTSDKGSAKGSDRGSTKGSERDFGDNASTASLLKKYGICDKAAIGKGATAVVRLAHKWDRREEKLYAVKVSFSFDRLRVDADIL